MHRCDSTYYVCTHILCVLSTLMCVHAPCERAAYKVQWQGNVRYVQLLGC